MGTVQARFVRFVSLPTLLEIVKSIKRRLFFHASHRLTHGDLAELGVGPSISRNLRFPWGCTTGCQKIDEIEHLYLLVWRQSLNFFKQLCRIHLEIFYIVLSKPPPTASSSKGFWVGCASCLCPCCWLEAVGFRGVVTDSCAALGGEEVVIVGLVLIDTLDLGIVVDISHKAEGVEAVATIANFVG